MVAPSPQANKWVPRKGGKLLLCSEKYQIREEVEHIKNIRGAWIIKFTGTNTINQAYKRVNYSIYSTHASNEDDLEDAAAVEDEYTVKDVKGCVWGKVKHIETSGIHGANRILEVVGDKDTEHVIYVPFTDGIVKKIDHEKKIITIDPPDGLKELNKG